MDLTLPINGYTYNLRVSAIIEYDGGYLFDTIPSQTGFYPIGGRVKFDETFESALRREMREELGATITSFEMMGVGESFFEYEGQNFHEQNIIYRVAIDAIHDRKPGIVVIKEDEFSQYNIVPEYWSDVVMSDNFKFYRSESINHETDGDICVNLYDNNEFDVRVSALIRKGNKILVDTSAADRGHLVPIGGRMAVGEWIEAGLKREISEELTTEVIASEFLGVTEEFFDFEVRSGMMKHIHFVCFNFAVDVDHSAIKFDDGCEGHWMGIEDFLATDLKLKGFKQYVK